MMTLEEAIELARRFHEGAVDKSGRPYIEHPLRVMNRVSSEEAKLAAVLHDLVEDTSLSLEDLAAAGCPARVLQAVDALTRRSDESYEEFVARAAGDPLARVVKLADIEDNLDPDRLAQLHAEEAARLRAKYGRARATLEATVPADPAQSPYAIGEPAASGGGPYTRFDCAACGHPAGRVELTPGSYTTRKGEPYSDVPAVVVTSLMGRLVSRVEAEQVRIVTDAIAAADGTVLHRLDLAPFWCRFCGRAYCRRHWATETVMDEGFYDCTYGTCPAGHRVMIDD